MPYPVYPEWMKEHVLKMYYQGLSYEKVEILTGVGHTAIRRWCDRAGISRSHSESQMGHSVSQETRQKISSTLKKGDDIGYAAQHYRAVKDFPDPLGTCQFPDCEDDATDRARIDHSNLPYRKEYVLPMCHIHNCRHDLYHKGKKLVEGFVILFQEKA